MLLGTQYLVLALLLPTLSRTNSSINSLKPLKKGEMNFADDLLPDATGTTTLHSAAIAVDEDDSDATVIQSDAQEEPENNEEKALLDRVIHRCKEPGQIALTFDDGVSVNTLQVLDILHQNNIKATFFIIGHKLDKEKVDDGPEGVSITPKEVIEKIIAEGHVVGSHSYTHPDFTRLYEHGIIDELSKTSAAFEKLIGQKPRFFRPPYGYVTSRVLAILKKLNYVTIRWSIDTDDWKGDAKLSIDKFKMKITSRQSPEIVLMHDNQSKIHEYLPEIIRHAKSKGYKFVTMAECLQDEKLYFD